MKLDTTAAVASIPVVTEAVSEPTISGVQRIVGVVLPGREAVTMTTQHGHAQAMTRGLQQYMFALPQVARLFSWKTSS